MGRKRKHYGECAMCAKPLRYDQKKCCSFRCAGAFRTQEYEKSRKTVCNMCGITFIKPKPNGAAMKGKQKSGIYCSRRCRGYGRSMLCAEKRKAAGYPIPHYKIRSRKVYFPTCEVCGELFTTRHHNIKMCNSVGCIEADKINQKEIRREKLKVRVVTMNPASYGPRECAYHKCSVIYVREYGDSGRLYCSTRCSRRSAKWGKSINHRKRARHYGVEYEYINHKKVFDRDGWSCQVCGRKTPQSMSGKHKPTSPELDHRVPMASGGGHLYYNVQCTCRRCNGEKSNHSSAGQLPMFGIGEVLYTGRGQSLPTHSD